MGLNPARIRVVLLLVCGAVWIGLRVLLLSAQAVWQAPELSLAREFQAELRQRGLLSPASPGMEGRRGSTRSG